MKEKYTLADDGFVGYWHPTDHHKGRAIIVFPGSGADYELTRKGSQFLRKSRVEMSDSRLCRLGGLARGPCADTCGICRKGSEGA